MPATSVNINLLGKEDLSRTPGGRIISWAVTYGRYIMIGTEIVVLLAFASRFSLDRKLTDLKEQIAQKQAILEANRQLEQTIKNIQERTAKINTITRDQDKLVNILLFLQTSLPPDVRLDTLTVAIDKMSTQVVAGSNAGFSQFLETINSNKELSKVEIGDVKKRPLTGIEFQLVSTVGNPPAAKAEKK